MHWIQWTVSNGTGGQFHRNTQQWQKGFSARSLAYAWERKNDFPDELKKVLKQSGIAKFKHMEMLLGFPEYKVSLPGGSTTSQNDIFVLGRASDGLVVIAVEGKVDEPFGELIEDWKLDSSEGKVERLKYLSDRLGVDFNKVDGIRYQLIHRTASAVILAERFHASTALMLVHSFSQDDLWIDDYGNFVKLFNSNSNADIGINKITRAYNRIRGVDLCFGWVKGDKKYLEA